MASAGCIQSLQIMALRHTQRLHRQSLERKSWRWPFPPTGSIYPRQTAAQEWAWGQGAGLSAAAPASQLAAGRRVSMRLCYPAGPEGRTHARFPCWVEQIIQKHEAELPPSLALCCSTSVTGWLSRALSSVASGCALPGARGTEGCSTWLELRMAQSFSPLRWLWSVLPFGQPRGGFR